MRANRRTYIKVGIHTTKNFEELEKDLEAWADLYSYIIKR